MRVRYRSRSLSLIDNLHCSKDSLLYAYLYNGSDILHSSKMKPLTSASISGHLLLVLKSNISAQAIAKELVHDSKI
jgi:hypothetical protein